MQKPWIATGLLLLALLAGGLLRGLTTPANAQPQAAAEVTERYQIRAFATATAGGTDEERCYILDTSTGQLWRSVNGGPPIRTWEGPQK